MTEKDWDTFRQLVEQARVAYYVGDEARFHALAYMLQVTAAGLKEAYLDRPSKERNHEYQSAEPQ